VRKCKIGAGGGVSLPLTHPEPENIERANSMKPHYIDFKCDELLTPKDKALKKVNRVDCHAQVLIVDDNDFSLVTMPLLLRTKYNFTQCDVARDGPSAIEMCRRAIEERRDTCECHQPYVIVFMDNEMYPMSGNEATMKIKLLEDIKYNPLFTTKVVSMSGMVALKDIKNSKEAGIDDFVGKPPDPNHMKRVISTIFK